MKKKMFLMLIAALMSVFLLTPMVTATAQQNYDKKYTIVSPYEQIDFNAVMHAKSGLHVHTRNSGVVWNDSGLSTPDAVIDGYEKAGFNALAITDHDYVSYPWSNNSDKIPARNVNSPNSSLISIPGNELSKSAHTLSYGVEYFDSYDAQNIKNQSTTVGYDQNIINVGNLGGVLYLAHPRRNDQLENKKNSAASVSYSDQWWLSKFTSFPQVKGIEVLNCGQFSNNHSERLWDSLLTKSMPNRVIYGTASDDNHGSTSNAPTSNLGTGWTNLLLAEGMQNEKGAVNALATGKTYFSTYMLKAQIGGENDDNKARPSTPVPSIKNIEVDNEAGTISITADYANKVEWISGYDSVNAVSIIKQTDVNQMGTSSVQFTATFNVEQVSDLAGYVRIRIIGDGGQTQTQPFALKKYYPTLTVSSNELGISFSAESINYNPEKYLVATDNQFSNLVSVGGVLLPNTTLYAKALSSFADQPTPIFTINLPSRPDSPKLAISSRSDVTIKFSKAQQAQYRIANSEWQDNNEFKGLIAGTKYNFEMRIKATTSSFASEVVSAEFSTKDGAEASSGGCGNSVTLPVIIIFFVLIIALVVLIKRKREKL